MVPNGGFVAPFSSGVSRPASQVIGRSRLLRRNPLVYPAGALAGIDPLHPASRNLMFSGVPLPGPNFINLVPGIVSALPTIVGAPTYSIDPTLGPLFNCMNNADIANWSGFPTTAFSVGTMACIFVSRGNNSGGVAVIGGDSGSTSIGMGQTAYQSNIGSVGDVRWNGTQYVFASPMPLDNANTPYFFAYTVLGGVRFHYVMQNLWTGQTYFQVNGATPGATTTGSGTFSVGNRPSATGRELFGGVAAMMRSNVYLSPSVLMAWCKDPWAFWYPNNPAMRSAAQPR